jgi:hypothetical protein
LRAASDLGTESRLADARFAGDEQDFAPAGGGRSKAQGGDGFEVFGPADKHRAGYALCHRGIVRMRATGKSEFT